MRTALNPGDINFQTNLFLNAHCGYGLVRRHFFYAAGLLRHSGIAAGLLLHYCVRLSYYLVICYMTVLLEKMLSFLNVLIIHIYNVISSCVIAMVKPLFGKH